MGQHSAFWNAVETIHDVVYFSPHTKERYGALGLKGYWMGYFASRSAALGTPGPEVVIATFHGFSPAIVRRALPDAWELSAPHGGRDAILEARLGLARDALAPLLDGLGPLDGLVESLRIAQRGLDLAGKPLAAAQSAVPPTDDPVGALWHAATIFREYRGDCHLAVLTTAGLGGAAANALQVGTGRAQAVQRELRGWTEDEWVAAQDSLREWGWLDESGVATEVGTTARDRLEDATDRACDAGIDLTTRARLVTLAEPLRTLARAVADSDAVPFPNATGGQRP
ncbi:hypothetical protein ASD11_13555 [Aeromicrobium sp. Root495]|uniref:SCO6745 family protein n=1 Tax=Aeromicrobium sp. Root495 TaxID=1736550 RepID=UPI0006F29797|nr:hypothetical protein [Aeromicrobium sp. Root495]KQY60466.1 hypothetical protein ASD11_13555 [Aeromicrobium sp. Root495]